MSKIKEPGILHLRLSREAVDTIDEVSREMGGISRRSVVELLTRHARNVRRYKGVDYSSFLVSQELPAKPVSL